MTDRSASPSLTPGPVAAGDLDRLHARLARDAAVAGLLDVAYRTVDSPVGPLLLAATPAGLVRVAYEAEGHDAVLEDLAGRVSPRLLRADRRLDPVAGQLDDYWAGRRHRFDVALDLRLTQGFRRQVIRYLPSIGFGRTASYGEVAAALDHPRASRAVGTACATNPVPVVVPCHRIIRADGTLGAYLGGPETKARLLDLEGAR